MSALFSHLGVAASLCPSMLKGMNKALWNGRSAAVITVSDRCAAGTQQDLSGPAVVALLRAAGVEHIETLIVPDERPDIERALREAAGFLDLVLTTGGTGLAPRDVTPEATLAVCERLVPGLPEHMRQAGARQTPFASLSRGVCGVCDGALVLNLPGSPRGAEMSLSSVLDLLPHALALLDGDTAHE